MLFPVCQGKNRKLAICPKDSKCFQSSLRYSGHLAQLSRNRGLSSLDMGALGHVHPAQRTLKMSSCTYWVSLQRPLMSLQKPLDLFIPTHGTTGTSTKRV